jgi:hypothetical protein
MTKEFEALRLAEWLDKLDVRAVDKIQNCVSAAAELRRLHEANQAMLETLKWIADQTYDPWTNGAEAQRYAITAIVKGEKA